MNHSNHRRKFNIVFDNKKPPVSPIVIFINKDEKQKILSDALSLKNIVQMLAETNNLLETCSRRTFYFGSMLRNIHLYWKIRQKRCSRMNHTFLCSHLTT